MSEQMELAKRLRDYAGWHSMDIHEEERADLLAAAEAIEAGEWREIASAPKDGKGVELICARSGFVRVCYWDLELELWLLCGTGDTYYGPEYFTHWRPIPAPPEVTR